MTGWGFQLQYLVLNDKTVSNHKWFYCSKLNTQSVSANPLNKISKTKFNRPPQTLKQPFVTEIHSLRSKELHTAWFCHRLKKNHSKVLLFNTTANMYICFQLELKKMLLDRMVNLLSRGCVVPVLRYVKQCWQRGDTDISLIRYFITEVN